MKPRHLVGLTVVALGMIIFGAIAASGGTPKQTNPVDAEDRRVAMENSRRSLGQLISQGKEADQVGAEVLFLEPLSITDVRSLVREHQLEIEQFKAIFPGISQQLSAGYVVQPGQTFDEALDKFTSLQEPYMIEKIAQIEVALNDPTLSADERDARERQLADVRTYHQSLISDGVNMSSIRVLGTSKALMNIVEHEADRAVVAVTSNVGE